MATCKYFNGETELSHPRGMDNKEFAVRFSGQHARKFDGFAKLVGRVAGSTPVFVQGEGWKEELLPVQRTIVYSSRPSLHKCDARCMNAKGHNCECSCGGKNHGAGGFRAEAA